MPRSPSIRSTLRTLFIVGMWLVFTFLIFMWIVSNRLSSAGIEFERLTGGYVENQWYGVVYPGTGLVMIGGEVTYHPYHGQHYDAVDLGAAWLKPPFEDKAVTWWEHRGFIWERGEKRFWVGIPAWLAAALGGVPPLWWFYRRRRTIRGSDSPAAPGVPTDAKR